MSSELRVKDRNKYSELRTINYELIMADTFLLEIVTPDKLFLSEQVEEMTAPGDKGEFGVLAGHAPLLTTLQQGELSYKIGKDTMRISIGSGYAEVGPAKVTILTETVS